MKTITYACIIAMSLMGVAAAQSRPDPTTAPAADPTSAQAQAARKQAMQALAAALRKESGDLRALKSARGAAAPAPKN